jgi:hypothetical protein
MSSRSHARVPLRTVRRPARQQALAAFMVGVVLLVGLLVPVLSKHAWRRSGYDDTPVQLVIGVLPVGSVGCQPHELVPAGTGAVRIRAAPAGPGGVAVRVGLREASSDSGVGSTGVAVAGGIVVAALAHRTTAEIAASLCIWNTGQAPLALSGSATGPADQLTITTAGKPAGAMVGRVRVEDLESAHPSSLWSALDKLPERDASATGSALAPWLTLIGLIGAVVLVGALLWAPGGEDGV